MQLSYTVDLRQIDQALAAVSGRMTKAAMAAMREIADGAKDALRGVVKSKFKRTPPVARRYGQDFVKSFRGDVYPKKGESLTPAAMVYSKAGFSQAFEDGATVGGRPRLAIPLPAARRLGLDRGMEDSGAGMRFKKWSQLDEAKRRFGDDMVTVRGKRGPVVGVRADKAAEYGLRGGKREGVVGLFVIRRSVRLDKRLDATAIVKRWADRIDEIYKRELG